MLLRSAGLGRALVFLTLWNAKGLTAVYLARRWPLKSAGGRLSGHLLINLSRRCYAIYQNALPTAHKQ